MFERIPFLSFMLVTGGICIFLIGLDISKKAFKKTLGEGLSRFMYNISHSKILSFIFGTSLSAISQSSTATSSFSVGLVDVGMLPLESAMVVIMGASIGTVFVTLLISLEIIIWAPGILAISTIVARTGRGKLVQAATLIEGLSLLLTGMLILKLGIEPLLSDGSIKNILLSVSEKPFYLGIASFIMVSVIQSSPAVMAMAIALASAGVLSISSIVAVVLGSHLGSSSMVLLSSLGSRVNARRLAWSNFIFRLTGILTFIPVSGHITTFTSSLTPVMSSQVALIHLSVAACNVCIGLPFSSILAKLVQRVIVASEEESIGEPAFLLPSMQEFPLMAMNLLAKEMIRLGSFCEEMFTLLIAGEGYEERLLSLQKGTERLLSICMDFFSGIAPPGPLDYWKTEYSSISYSLVAMKDLTETVSEKMYVILKKKNGPLIMANIYDGDLQELNRLLSRLITLSVGAFALGGKEISRTAKKVWRKYTKMEQQIRSRLLAADPAFHAEEDMYFLEYLSASNKIARASYELARGALIEADSVSIDRPGIPWNQEKEEGGITS